MERHFNKKWDNVICHRENGKLIIYPEYSQWKGMTVRCSGTNTCSHREKFYSESLCSDTFKNFDVYLSWAKQQVGFLSRDENGALFQLDKDFLVKGNKVYSEETCVFIPQRLNKFLTLRGRERGTLPVGVYRSKETNPKKLYIASGNFKEISLPKQLGYFPTPEEAFCKYKDAKEALAKCLAVKYSGLVDKRVIDMLNNFTINIDD